MRDILIISRFCLIREKKCHEKLCMEFFVWMYVFLSLG